MQKIFTIMLTDLRIFFADRGNLIGLLVIPAVLTIVLGSFGGGSGMLEIRVIDHDQSELSAQLVTELEAGNPRFHLEYSEDEAETLALLDDGRVNALLIIPEGFGEAVLTYAPIELQFYSNEENTAPSAIQASFEAVIGRWNGAIVAERVGSAVAANINAELETGAIYNRAQAILEQEPVHYDFQVAASNEASASGFSQSVPGMGSMFVMFTVLGGLSALVKERQQWTLQRMVVMPISRAELLAGKILGFFVLGMLQYLVVIAIGAAFGMSFGKDVLAFLLVAAVFALCTTALSLALGTRIRTEGQAGQLTTLLSLALASLGGAWWPLEIVPEFMKVLGHISPVAWAMDGFHDLLFYGGTIVDVLPEVGILLAISVVLFGLGIWGFKYE
jgi:ABC-2 type transport system permease protein